MIKKQRTLLLTYIIFLISIMNLLGRDSQIILGEEDLWSQANLANLNLIEGKRGYFDITNSDNSHLSDMHSDLILPFNSPSMEDVTGKYEILQSVPIRSSENSFGGGSAFFDGESKVIIEQKSQGLFSPSRLWDDFSLEFRLYPATLKEGSTVFLWKGLQMIGDQLIPQEIRCTVNNRHLVWDFENFFLYPDDALNRVTLKGDKLIPGIWSHHLISFDSETGLLEYRIDNIPSDSTYTSKSGRETSEFNLPIIGNQQSFPIELGENFSGLLDEFRLRTALEDRAQLNKFTHSGILETDIVDLKVTGSTLIRVNTDSKTPENTSIRMEYALSDNKLDLLGPSVKWINILSDQMINEKGRYLKLRVRLNAEPASQSAPVLSNIKINYREAAPPHPPLNLSLSREEQNVIITWDKSIDPEIAGYLLYYGEEPGVYFSTGSPIDTGSENSIILTELDLNRRYYFAVTSYRFDEARLESRFSDEISYSP